MLNFKLDLPKYEADKYLHADEIVPYEFIYMVGVYGNKLEMETVLVLSKPTKNDVDAIGYSIKVQSVKNGSIGELYLDHYCVGYEQSKEMYNLSRLFGTQESAKKYFHRLENGILTSAELDMITRNEKIARTLRNLLKNGWEEY